MPEQQPIQLGPVRRMARLLGRLAASLLAGWLLLGWTAPGTYWGTWVVELRHVLGLALLAASLVLGLGRSWRTAAACVALGLCACASGWWLRLAARPEPAGGAGLRVGVRLGGPSPLYW